MLLDDLFDHLGVVVEPFAVCVVADGWRMRLPDPPGAILHFVLEGEGELELSHGVRARLAPGTFVLVPHRQHSIVNGEAAEQEQVVHVPGRRNAGSLAEVVVGIEAPGALHFACGHVLAHYAGGLELFDLLDEPIVLDRSDDPDLAATIRRLLRESSNPGPGHAAMLTNLMRDCLLQLLRALCDRPDCRLPWLTALDHPQLTAPLREVLAHPAGGHTVRSLAATAGLSRSAFAEAFTAAFDETPMAFVRSVRLRHAARLLRTSDLPVAAVARRSGIASRSHFTRLFSEHYGVTPADYRRGDARSGVPDEVSG